MESPMGTGSPSPNLGQTNQDNQDQQLPKSYNSKQGPDSPTEPPEQEQKRRPTGAGQSFPNHGQIKHGSQPPKKRVCPIENQQSEKQSELNKTSNSEHKPET